MVPGDDLKATVAAVFEKMGRANGRRATGSGRAGAGRPAGRGLARGLQHAAQLRQRIHQRADQSGAGHAHRAGDAEHGQHRLGSGAGYHHYSQRPWTSRSGRRPRWASGMVTIGNARHLGMASYHAMMALEHDMIGVCMTSCPPSVVPTFGAEPRLGTNPIAIAVPSRNEGAVRVRRRHQHRGGQQGRYRPAAWASNWSRVGWPTPRATRSWRRPMLPTTTRCSHCAARVNWARTRATGCRAWWTSWPEC